MPTSSLQAKANTGVGTDNIAGINVAQGFIGAGMLTDAVGEDIAATNPLPAAATQLIDAAGFSAVGSSVLDVFFNAPIVGTGVTYNQAAGALNIVAGTSARAEFLARSVRSYTGSMRLRSSHILSNRIVNNNFALLLADLIGEGLAYTINSATSVTVNVPAHGFHVTQMVGQFILMGGITGAAGVPGRYAIASIPDANNITFTVAGWPASGSGSLTLFGRNYLRNLFAGTTVTNVSWDVQRNGWTAGDTVATINTTASPGVVLMSALTGREAWLGDKLRATSTAPSLSLRAFRDENIPDPNVPLFVFLWSFNGTTAPASSTTWTLGHVSVEDYPNQEVFIGGVRPQGTNNPLPIVFQSAQPIVFQSAQSVNATLVASAVLAGDVGVQYRGNATGAASASPVLSPLVPAGQSIKGAAGRLAGYDLHNAAASRRYVKFYNATTVTMGTTAALFEVCLEPNQTKTISYSAGVGFSTGIQIAVTSGRGLTDNTATGVALGDVTGHVNWA
jgi:hypothetical protein